MFPSWLDTSNFRTSLSSLGTSARKSFKLPKRDSIAGSILSDGCREPGLTNETVFPEQPSEPKTSIQVQALEAQLADLRRQNRHLERDLSKIRRTLHESEELVSTLRSQLADQEQSRRHLQRAETRVQELTKDNQEARRLLVTKTRDLESANKFLSTTDSASVADACRLLETLNNEIFQFTALVAEDFVAIPQTQKSQPFSETTLPIRQFLGDQVFSLLQQRDEDTRQLIVQLTLQETIVYFAGLMVSSWSLADSVMGDKMMDIYQRICSGGIKRIAGTWRSITRGQIHPASSFTPDHFSLIEFLSRNLAPILIVAGWDKGGEEDVSQFLLSKYRPQLTVVCETALKLNKVIGEQITSVDLELTRFHNGEPFDKTCMVDSFEEVIGEGDVATVLLTTDIGLCQVERGDAKDKTPPVVLVKPKVVLAKSLIG